MTAITTSLEDSDEDEAFESTIASYECMYGQNTYSRHPRLELLTAALVFGIAIGLIATVARHAYHLSSDFIWLAFWFLGAFAFRLRGSLPGTIVILDEMLYRISYLCGLRIVPYPEARRWSRLLYAIPSFTITVVLIVTLAFAVLDAMTTLYPVFHVPHARFAGGG